MLTVVNSEVVYSLKLTFEYIDPTTNEKTNSTITLQNGSVYTIKYKKMPTTCIRTNTFVSGNAESYTIEEITGIITDISSSSGTITIDGSKTMSSLVVKMLPSEIIEVTPVA